ncbi:MAG TPA: DUF4390 domain-containing protein [Burkholderiaceae bacterium]|nr:DUF4390 domain-containing protein [Burkholderiaceae bacterium]
MPLAWTSPLILPPGLTGRLRRAVAWALVAIGLFAGGVAAAERIAITRAILGPSAEADGGVVLDAQFDFELPPVLEDAVNRGIALYFIIEFEMHRERWYWFDRKVAGETLSYRLTYSPLTRQYRLSRDTLALPFDSLNEALNSLRRVRGWRVFDQQLIAGGGDFRAQVRMRLDTSQLPRPFQINALTNRDWTLSSDWFNLRMPPEAAK